MTILLDSITEVLDEFDCAVLDQWGVLHDGTTLYPGVVPCLEKIRRAGKGIVVLSNSGKRAAPNRERIESMGVPSGLIDDVITSGEILWNEIRDARFCGFGLRPFRAFAITRIPKDRQEWLAGLNSVSVVDEIGEAEVVLFLGTPDGIGEDHFDNLLNLARAKGLSLVCANPDKSSPRSSGAVISPGFFADRYCGMGGRVINYGKPFPAVFDAVRKTGLATSVDRYLMIGDSLEHDIAGAKQAGMKTLFVRGGLLANNFEGILKPTDTRRSLSELSNSFSPAVVPDYSLYYLN